MNGSFKSNKGRGKKWKREKNGRRIFTCVCVCVTWTVFRVKEEYCCWSVCLSMDVGCSGYVYCLQPEKTGDWLDLLVAGTRLVDFWSIKDTQGQSEKGNLA